MRLLPGLLFLALLLPAPAEKLSPMARAPDWSTLNGYQRTITRDDFERLINQVYSPDGGFWSYATINDQKVTLFTDATQEDAGVHALLRQQRGDLPAPTL